MFDKIRDRLREKIRLRANRNPAPSAAVIDSQSVKAAETVGKPSRGYDGGKKIRDTARPSAIDDSDRRWLLDRIDQVRHELARLDWPLGYGLIHGDAWAGNLMRQTGTVILGDWDSTCWGPREVDLIPTWHAAIRFGRGWRWADEFAAEYGYDLRRWSGFATLFAVRDLVQLVALLRLVPRQPALAGSLGQRLRDIKAGDATAVWLAN